MFDFLNVIDWVALFKIIGVDIMLGVDNALVIAMACATLSAANQKKGILYGTMGAVGLRIILLVFASFIMSIPYVGIVAGGYLLYIGYSLLESSDEPHDVQAGSSIFEAVKIIIIADFMMSLDNILAVTAASHSTGDHALYYAIGGVLFSIPVIMFSSKGLIQLIERFPIITWFGGGLLGWVGAEMVLKDTHIIEWFNLTHFQDVVIQVIAFFGVISTAWLVNKFQKH